MLKGIKRALACGLTVMMLGGIGVSTVQAAPPGPHDNRQQQHQDRRQEEKQRDSRQRDEWRQKDRERLERQRNEEPRRFWTPNERR